MWPNGLEKRALRPEKETHGWVAERFKAPVLKTGDVKASVGSNPTPSAIRNLHSGTRYGGESLSQGR
jgi:hypothetical protein